MTREHSLSRYQEAFIRLFYPESCGACSTYLELDERILCAGCQETLIQQKRRPEQSIESVRTEYLDDVWTVFPYESMVQDLLSKVKFQGKRRLLLAFRESLVPIVQSLQSEAHYDFIVPIPISRSKLTSREFNQSVILADLVSELIRTPVLNRTLSKRHQAPAQSLLSRRERLANAFGTMKVTQGRKVFGKRFLVVDDIYTTGATGEEAARVLKSKGAKQVDLFALARTELKESH